MLLQDGMFQDGLRYGNYLVMDEIGHGAFADVYLGKHLYLDTYAAIKVLRTTLEPQDLQTFIAEARTVAALRHPYIVRVLDFGEETHVPYLVMDYAAQGTLRQRHPKGSRVPLETCIAYVRQIAEALQYAHERKVIHRDVKPENILLEQDGRVLLSDFGIAVISRSSCHTNDWDVGGTILYMAPEQLLGGATMASDQYALAVVFYELLTGHLPFEGSFAEVAGQHCLAPVPALSLTLPGIPEAVEEVVQKALSKDPRQRYPGVREFGQALVQAAYGESQNWPSALLDLSELKISHEHRSTKIVAIGTAWYECTLNWIRNKTSVLCTTVATVIVPRATQTFITFSHTLRRYPRYFLYPLLALPILIVILSVLVCNALSADMRLLHRPLAWGMTVQESPVVTPIPTKKPRKKPTPTPTRQENNTSGSGSVGINSAPNYYGYDYTLYKNGLMSCGGCASPLRVTLGRILVEPHAGRMTWYVSLYHKGGRFYVISFVDVSVSSGRGSTLAASYDTQPFYMGAGDNEERAFTFPLPPVKGRAYTFHLRLVADQTYTYTYTCTF